MFIDFSEWPLLKWQRDDGIGGQKVACDTTSAQTLTNKTLTAPVLGAATATSLATTAGVTGPDAAEVVTTTNPITAAESGTTFILNSATAFVSTLPAPALGLRYRFIIGNTPPSGGNHTIVTTGSANIIDGGAMVAGAEVSAVDEDSINFVDGCLAGDFVEVWSDGTNWYVNGRATTAAKLTFTSAA